MLLGYTATKVPSSPKNLTWFTRPFLLVRGWYLGMHCWFNVMAHKPCHRLLFHERGKQNSYELIFSWLWVSVMHGLTWGEVNYCAWFALSMSSLPLSVLVGSCHALTSAVFVPRASFMPTLHSGSSPSWTWKRAGHSHARNYPRTFSLHEIFKCTHLKIYGIWPQTDIHTHNLHKCSHASVGLVQARPNKF